MTHKVTKPAEMSEWGKAFRPEINFRADSQSRLSVGLSYEAELQFKPKTGLLKFVHSFHS